MNSVLCLRLALTTSLPKVIIWDHKVRYCAAKFNLGCYMPHMHNLLINLYKFGLLIYKWIYANNWISPINPHLVGFVVAPSVPASQRHRRRSEAMLSSASRNSRGRSGSMASCS